MADLIEALTIFAKYQSDRYAPVHCEHDVLYVVGVGRGVDREDRKRLKELGFLWFGSEDAWGSFRFGSA